jgi:hypothetical protein
MAIDPTSSLTVIDDRIAATSDEGQRAMLSALRGRLVGEMTGDLEKVGASLAPHFQVRSYPNQGMVADDREGMLAILSMAFTAGIYKAMWVDWTRLMVDGNIIAGDGKLRMVMPRAIVQQMHPDAAVDEGSTYLVSSPVAIFIDFDGGLMAREVIYTDPSATEVRKLEPGELVEGGWS